MALRLAARLNCDVGAGGRAASRRVSSEKIRGPRRAGAACGAGARCPACAKIRSFEHPDLHLIHPVPSGEWEKDLAAVIESRREDFFAYGEFGTRARSVGIDLIRHVIEALSKQPFEGRRSVVVRVRGAPRDGRGPERPSQDARGAPSLRRDRARYGVSGPAPSDDPLALPRDPLRSAPGRGGRGVCWSGSARSSGRKPGGSRRSRRGTSAARSSCSRSGFSRSGGTRRVSRGSWSTERNRAPRRGRGARAAVLARGGEGSARGAGAAPRPRPAGRAREGSTPPGKRPCERPSAPNGPARAAARDLIGDLRKVAAATGEPPPERRY